MRGGGYGAAEGGLGYLGTLEDGGHLAPDVAAGSVDGDGGVFFAGEVDGGDVC